MFRFLHNRFGHYALLLAVSSALFLPGLGTPSLWDIDEGNNAECAKEMLGANNWIVPTFNYKLRTDKPAMLYWLQMLAYRQFGINEFSARLPSALASILSVLLTYELGRRLYDCRAGLLAGLVLASAPAFSAAAHFANPDALLNLFTLLTLLIFWQGYVRRSGSWFALAGISTGLAMLTKGPVGLILPGAVITLFLIWSGEWKRLLDARLLWGIFTFVAVSAPWYGWVGNDTRWEFLKGFFLTHNLARFRAPMEGHSGNFLYYILVILGGLLIWACFLGPAFWFGFREALREKPQEPHENSQGHRNSSLSAWWDDCKHLSLPFRFLLCWIAVYVIFFSLSRTKLPNYILPVYPAVALLLGRFLDRWRRVDLQMPPWVMRTGLGLIAFIGILITSGFVLADGSLGGAALLHGRFLPGLGRWAGLGLIPVLGSLAIAWCVRKEKRSLAIQCLTGTAALFTGLLAWGPTTSLDSLKAPREFGILIHEQQTDPEIRIATYQYFQPSLVFYCGREVTQFSSEQQAVDLMGGPLPAYLLIPSTVWDDLQKKFVNKPLVLGMHRDLYRNCDVVLVKNR